MSSLLNVKRTIFAVTEFCDQKEGVIVMMVLWQSQILETNLVYIEDDRIAHGAQDFWKITHPQHHWDIDYNITKASYWII